MQHGMNVVHGVGGEAARAMDPTLTEQPGVVGVDLGGVQVLQLHSSQLRDEVLLHQHAIAGKRRAPHTALDRRQPDLEQELPQAETAGQDVVCSAKVVSLRVRAAWQSLRQAKPPLVSRLRSSFSCSSPPQAGQVSLGRRSIQKRLPQLWQRWAR
jgi:hypothetical protein